MPPFCSYCVAQFVSTKEAFSLPTHIVRQAASFTKVAGDPLNSQIYTSKETNHSRPSEKKELVTLE